MFAICTTFIVLIAFPNFSEIEQTRGRVLKFDTEWINTTVDMITAFRTVDGGYAEFQTEPELYSTYYFTLTLRELGLELKYKEETTRYLAGELSKNPDVERLFYISRTLYLLGEFDNYSSEICSMNLTIEQSYPDLLFASEILKMCSNYSMLNVIMEDYRNLSEKDIFVVDAVLTSLKNMGVDLSTLPNIGRWRELVQSKSFSMENFTEGGLLELETLLHLAKMLNVSLNVSKDVLDYISTHQSVDGGFSLFFDNCSDEYGTYSAVKILLDFGREFDEERVVRFIRTHELPSGGFSPAVRTTTNAKSTLHAIYTLMKFGKLPDKTAVEFLRNRHRDAMEALKFGAISFDLYPTTAALSMLGEDVGDVEQVLPFVDMFISGGMNPRGLYLCIATLEAAGYQLDGKRMAEIADRLHEFERDCHYCFSAECNQFEAQRDTAMALEMLSYIGAEPLNAEAIADWLEGFRNGDGGYGLNGSSNVLSTYYVVKSLRKLGRCPDANVVEFLNNCKKWGGFAMFPEGKPTLTSTYYALKTMEYLQDCL